MRGIQYAAASRFHLNFSGILDHPLSRMMTAVGVRIAHRIGWRRSQVRARHHDQGLDAKDVMLKDLMLKNLMLKDLGWSKGGTA
jgi:hypothetical protein